MGESKTGAVCWWLGMHECSSVGGGYDNDELTNNCVFGVFGKVFGIRP